MTILPVSSILNFGQNGPEAHPESENPRKPLVKQEFPGGANEAREDLLRGSDSYPDWAGTGIIPASIRPR